MTHGPAPLPTDTSPPIRSRSHSRHTRPHPPPLFRTLLHHSSAPRQSTDLVISSAIRSLHPKLHLTIIPSSSIHLLDFASAGHATCILDPHSPAQIWQETSDITETWFGKYKYVYQDEEFILYVVQWKDSLEMEITRMQYLLGKWNKEGLVKELLKETEAWEGEIGERIWVFDQGRWKKEAGLWGEIQKAKWGDVVLEKGLKERVKGDVERFFGSRERYKELGVPWKRGVIFHGPPGNGKTISIKALMHTISDLDHPVVPNLYVKTFHSMYGDEKSISDIFQKAREVAPCLLVFEDLDSLVSDGTRSYFLNEVDGLASNDGICMIGSTNHLDRLDPGIAKRPSRFDRKYLFPIPGKEERVEYCKFWQKKLEPNKSITFPDSLCDTIADLTDNFSFAYLKEAFVASLLMIAGDKDRELEDALREQIKNLRDEMDGNPGKPGEPDEPEEPGEPEDGDGDGDGDGDKPGDGHGGDSDGDGDDDEDNYANHATKYDKKIDQLFEEIDQSLLLQNFVLGN